MKPSWIKSAIPIAAIFSFRMLGLFMLIPVFTIYAHDLLGATPLLLGIALGSYGLSQGLLQIPFGMLSDRYGRKPILILGLLLFATGSIIGAHTQSIYGMIFARILQGSGAIGSVLIALLADLTADEHRTKAMAIIGITIGLSFSVALIISPFIAGQTGLAGIFYLSAVLAVLGLFIVQYLIPTPKRTRRPALLNQASFKAVITNPHLLRLDIGIFFQHLLLTSTFFAIPPLLQHYIQQGQLSNSWAFYLPMMCLSFLVMMPCMMMAEKKFKTKLLFCLSVGATSLSQWLLGFQYDSFISLSLLMFMYFVAFNLLEASLPSLVSKQAHQQSRGAASGVYSSSQFLGIFVGGALSGLVFEWFGYAGIFFINGSIGLIWLYIAFSMQPLHYQFTFSIPYPNIPDVSHLKTQLNALPGICEVEFNQAERLIYLQAEKSLYRPGSAEEIIEKNEDFYHK